MPNIVAFIQARRTSTRLPGKVDLPLGKIPVIERVAQAALAAEIVNGAKVLWAEDYPDISENDVLSRYWQAYQDLPVGCDAIVRLTGDCPLMDPQVIDLVVKQYLSCRVGYCSNIYPRRTFPDGLDVEVFDAGLLATAYRWAADPYDREHVTPWMQKHSPYSSVELPVDWSHVRLTLDTQEDYEWLKSAINSPRSG